jgi:hypothetical protein
VKLSAKDEKYTNIFFINVGTILEEQQAQRIDIRSLHTELHASKDELKAEILSARANAKAERIDALEENAGIPHPDKN